MKNQFVFRATVVAAFALPVAAPTLAAQQKCPANTPGAKMPLTYQGGPTVAAITACDLMTRLYIYAADSLRGREAGTPDIIRATAYIEREVRRLGLLPAGDNGTYFQYMPVTARVLSQASSISAGGKTFHPGPDFTANAAADRTASGDVIFGGTQGDTVNVLSADDARGKIVVMLAGAAGAGRGGRGGGRGGAANNPLAGAAAIVTVNALISVPRLQYVLNDTMQNEGRAKYAAANPPAANAAGGRGGRGGAAGPAPLAVTVSPAVASAMLGKPVANAVRGDKGGAATIDIKGDLVAEPTRSVVAILPGTDPKLKSEYIVIGAHSDHIGMSNTNPPVEHDSLKAYNMIARVEGADTRNAPAPTPEQWVRINAIKDSLRKIYPARLDSVSNGADDDGSGSVSILEIAEAFAKGPVKPKRSLIFIWQTGEEKGLWGSQFWTNHPTVPLTSVVADLNLDMVGRGAATDVTGRDINDKELTGAENYLQLVGSRRLSTELGDIAEQVSASEPMPFKFDYSMDANGHTQNIYCRSDHANYARYGIPVIFFTTGGHADYHQVTDEPEYIQYEHMARVDKLVYDIALKVGNLDHRVVVDKTKPDSPFARCQQ
ncbi:MAG TPA: M28 family peptidase [Gemmatimonadaceae bacterium]|nr:M28 family peptidase [Gemmatimonadaceae bacterium]